VTAADLNKEIAMKIYPVVSVYKDALVDGANNSDQDKFAVGESDEQKFDSMDLMMQMTMDRMPPTVP
jgi:hypothetical protein